MGECGLRGGYSEVINLDPNVKAMLLKSISAMLCPTVLGQVKFQVIMNFFIRIPYISFFYKYKKMILLLTYWRLG